MIIVILIILIPVSVIIIKTILGVVCMVGSATNRKYKNEGLAESLARQNYEREMRLHIQRKQNERNGRN